MSDSERSALESDGRSELASAAELESDTMPAADIRYLYYLLYTDDDEIPSKVAFDPEETSLGRIRTDSVTPPHTLTSIKRCISRVERNPAIASAHANLFADTSCDTPLKEGQISLLSTDGPGLSPNEPMAIVVQVKKSPDPLPVASILDGRYIIRNRATNRYWFAPDRPNDTVFFSFYVLTTLEEARIYDYYQWDIKQDTNGNISIKSPYSLALFPWAGDGVKVTWSPVSVPWRLIPADGKFYYLTTNMNCVSQNPRVPVASQLDSSSRLMALKEGDQYQMWEFIRV